MKSFLIVCFFWWGFFIASLSAQQVATAPSKTTESTPAEQTKDGRSFRGVQLQSNYDTVMATLKQDALILVKPESDFQDFDEDPPTWIVASLPPLIDHLYYHFFNQKLYVISLFFNPKKTSYSELYQKLKNQYGSPTSMDAQETKWELPNHTLIVLDTLPSLKYIDDTLFDQLKTEDGTKTTLKSLEEQEKAFEEQILSDL